MMNRSTLSFVTVLSVLCGIGSAEDLTCLKEEERKANRLYAHLQQEAYAVLDKRKEACEALTTRADIRAYQRRLREFFVRQLGGFPERTSLNARTVGTIEADGYRIEKVIFESLPRHHITANLYLPKGNGPFPGVVVSSGHSRTGKTADYNQRYGIMMARHGMAALCFDPIGQGERSQILDDNGQPRFSGTTTEHFLIGVGSVLVGRNTARYRIWDAMRSIDYLVSRPEIDPHRIGMTGCSGDGTVVVLVDLRGQGETGSGKRDEQLGDWKTYYLAYLLGKSLTGMRVEDALAAGHFAGVYQGQKSKQRPVHLIGVGQAGIVALHAAALRPQLFASVTLHNTPHDWASVVRQTNPAGHLDSAIHGALEVYDLPDLVRQVGEEKVSYDK